MSKKGSVGIVPLGSSAHGNTLSVQVLTQTAVEFGQTAQLEVGHGLLGLLDLRWVADLARCVLRHLVWMLKERGRCDGQSCVGSMEIGSRGRTEVVRN